MYQVTISVKNKVIAQSTQETERRALSWIQGQLYQNPKANFDVKKIAA
jgi:hypothetical protein